MLSIEWITGFWEGEGTTGCWKNKHRKGGKQLVVQVCQNEQQIIEKIKHTLGYGTVSSGFGSGLGKSKMWRWTTEGVRAQQFLELILPYLKTDKRLIQVTTALEEFKKLKGAK